MKKKKMTTFDNPVPVAVDTKTSTSVENLYPEFREWQESMARQIVTYTTTWCETFGWEPDEAISVAEVALEALSRQEGIVETLESPDFQHWTQASRRLSGNVVGGKIGCIDGREDRRIQSGLVHPVWTTPGGVLDTVSFNGEDEKLASGRLKAAYQELGTDGKKLLQLHKGHTSLSDPHGKGCAAIAGEIKASLGLGASDPIPEDYDIIAHTVDSLKKNEKAIMSAYNGGRKEVGLKPVEKAIVYGIADTDTLGLLLTGNGEDKPLNTVDLARNLAGDLMPKLAQEYGEQYGKVGVLRETYTQPGTIIRFEEMNHRILSFLMDYAPYTNELDGYVENSDLKALDTDQKQALRAMVGRNLANQLLIGLYENGQNDDHAHSVHNEQYGSISFDGIHVGDFDPETQVLRANPADFASAVKQILVQHHVFGHYNGKPPYTIFLPVELPEGVAKKDRDAARGLAYSHLRDLAQEPQIKDLIDRKELMFIPVLMEKNYSIAEVPNSFA